MPICKFCAVPFSWGQKDDGKWVPLVPVGNEGDVDRVYQDENGVLRAEHAAICIRAGGPSVRVARLAKKVKASEIIGEPKVEKVDQETGEITPIDIGSIIPG